MTTSIRRPLVQSNQCLVCSNKFPYNCYCKRQPPTCPTRPATTFFVSQIKKRKLYPAKKWERKITFTVVLLYNVKFVFNV